MKYPQNTDETSNGLLWIDDDYTMRTSPWLEVSEYQSFASTCPQDALAAYDEALAAYPKIGIAQHAAALRKLLR